MIICFSGTGNSLYAARCIADTTGDEIIHLQRRNLSEKGTVLKSKRPWVFVCPIYAWRIPRIMEEYIQNNSFVGNDGAYFVVTCESEPGSADRYIKRLCKIKSLKYMGTSSVEMPQNLITMYDLPDEEHCDRLISSARKRLRGLGVLIESGATISDDKPRNIVKSSIFNPLFYKFYVNPEGFRSTDKCISCGECAERCPLGNISMKDGRPKWGDNCIFCMSCICRCPEDAIEFKNKTEGKERYVCRLWEDDIPRSGR